MSSRLGRRRPYPARRVANAVIVGLALAVVLPAVVVAETVRRGAGGRLARRAILAVAALCGVRIEIRGLERLDPACSYVFTPNHSSALDIAALLVVHPEVVFAAASELFRYPPLAAAMRALRAIPIERARPAAARKALTETATRLGRGACIVIFPEGRMAPPGELLPFKTGAFVFAVEAGVPILPVAIHHASDLLPRKSWLSVAPGRVAVEILAPIPTDGCGFTDRRALRDRAHAAVSAALGRSGCT